MKDLGEAIIHYEEKANSEQGAKQYALGYQDGFLDAKKQFERPQDKWIPISERLPEQDNQSYLVTVDYGNGLIRACERFFFNSEIGWNDDYVIAWQPLPEPYEKGGAE